MNTRTTMAKGAAWMVLFRLLDRSVGLISTVVLARLLVPADFGLVAMAMSVIAIIELATVFGFDIALIQHKAPERAHYDTAWTLNLMLAVGGSTVTVASAYPAALYYGDPRLAPVMVIIGLSWLLLGLSNIGVVDFRRNLDFASEFRLMAGKRMISFAVTMVLAFVFRSYWTLVIGTVAGRAIGMGMSYAMHPFRPRPSLRHTRELLSFSSWIVMSNLALVVLNRIPHFIVGRAFGARSLGAYVIGAELANLSHTELVAPINRALFPAFSRIVGDRPVFRRTCLEAMAVIFLIVMPVSVAVAIMASQVVRVLLGPQWGAAVPVMQMLAFAGAISALTANNLSAYQALGKPQLCTWVILSRMIILLVAVAAIGSTIGMLGVAVAELIAALGSLAVSVPILLKTLELRLRDYLFALWKPVVASAVQGGALYAVMPPVSVDMSVSTAMLELVASGALTLVVYPAAIAALWWLSGRREGVETIVFRRLREAIRARFNRPAT